MSHNAEDIMASLWSRPKASHKVEEAISKVSKASHNVEALAIMGSWAESQLGLYSTLEAVLSLYGLLQHGTQMSHKMKDLASKARRESWLCRGRGLKELLIWLINGE